MANKIQNNVDRPTVLASHRPVHHLRAATVKNRSAPNSIACHPFTIANQENPQNTLNWAIDGSLTKMCCCSTSKKSAGRSTVHEVPKINAIQIGNRMQGAKRACDFSGSLFTELSVLSRQMIEACDKGLEDV